MNQSASGFDNYGLERTEEWIQNMKDNKYNKKYGTSESSKLKNSISHKGVSTGRTISKTNLKKMHDGQKKYSIFIM